MISFTDITESIWHIRNNNKQKATTERKTYKDFVFVKTCQSHYKDLSALDLAEEINIPVSTSMLYKNDKNLFFIATSANISKKYHKPNELLDHFTDAV